MTSYAITPMNFNQSQMDFADADRAVSALMGKAKELRKVILGAYICETGSGKVARVVTTVHVADKAEVKPDQSKRYYALISFTD